MPAIPIYTASPINASKASGITPHTVPPDGTEEQVGATKTTSLPSPNTYPAAQPGAQPWFPTPTGTLAVPPNPAPTPTRTVEYDSPPAPQPGAFPLSPRRASEVSPSVRRGSYVAPPPRRGSELPPPPKVGESLRDDQPQAPLVPMPPQMAYTPLGAPELAARRSSTTTMPVPSAFMDPLGGRSDDGDLCHPPGYHQNINASEFNSSQRAAHDASVERSSHRMSLSGDLDDDEGVWGAAKKWASAASEGLAAAEHEVWKRINKD
ncbi:hypothetical protein AK830_g3934 [Neonectria ditissima]|uniref:Uncharacterized protein n=1 Tax=Neonectria ditissima TaxID=78410 RepID=A0A0P7BAG7_9HYPO|nr:hypothetical protein AK830_g3934 [Neonectria ditissima]